MDFIELLTTPIFELYSLKISPEQDREAKASAAHFLNCHFTNFLRYNPLIRINPAAEQRAAIDAVAHASAPHASIDGRRSRPTPHLLTSLIFDSTAKATLPWDSAYNSPGILELHSTKYKTAPLRFIFSPDLLLRPQDVYGLGRLICDYRKFNVRTQNERVTITPKPTAFQTPRSIQYLPVGEIDGENPYVYVANPLRNHV